MQLKRIAQIIESNAVRQLAVAQAYRVTPGTKGARLIRRTGFARDFGNLMLGNEIADLAQNVKCRACWFGCFLFHPCRVAGRNGQANTFFSNFCGTAVKWILKTFSDRPVIYVLGNHEFYGQKIPKLIEEIKEVAQGTNVHVLENGSAEIGDVMFFGATLWTDFCLNGDPVLAEVTAQTGMTDFRRIRMTPSYRRFRPADARRFHTQSLAWLAQQTSETQGRKIVVVTHHAPSPQSIPPRYQNDPLNPAFASNLEPFIAECGAALWIHGHIHHRTDFTLGGTRVVANPRGYPTEPHTGFAPSFVVEI